MTSGAVTNEPQLAPLTRDDTPALEALHSEAMEALGQQPWPAQAFADLLELPTTIGFKITLGDRIAAFILAQAAGGEAEILTLATAQAFRRQGMAETLIEIVRGECKRRKCPIIWLEVHAANDAALALYQKVGFLPKGERPNYYQDVRTGKRYTAVVMQCLCIN
jgi:ribosomal-protein-alanine N-acetyltransferase